MHSGIHIPALDGLRGIAILGVLACHFIRLAPEQTDFISRSVHSVAKHGWLGVDLFFVLSGFLITGILLDTRHKPRYFRNFYFRRVLRIFPLYYSYLLFFLTLLTALSLWSQSSPEVGNLWTDIGWAAVFLSNMQMVLQQSNLTPVLNHFWSLAIEEQFYLLWPFLVLLVAPRNFWLVCICVMALAVSLRLWLQDTGDVMAAAKLMPCRADSLAIGALLAAATRNPVAWTWLQRFRWPGIAIALSGVALAATANHPAFFYSAVALVFGGVLTLVVSMPNGSRTHRLLSAPLLRSFGKYSFAVYVLNQPIAFFPGNEFVFLRVSSWTSIPLLGTIAFAGAGIAITFGLAWASWHLLEKRCNALKRHFASASDQRP